jgi:hypothetical protein
MKKLIVTAILLCAFYYLSAQDNIINPGLNVDSGKRTIYKTKISLINGKHLMKGVLYAVNDSSVLISNSLVKKDYSTGKFELSKISFNNIDLIKIHRKNSVGRGIWIGALTGFATGGLLGWMSGDDPQPAPGSFTFTWLSAGDKAKMFGSLLAVSGVLTGALIGMLEHKIPINGNMGNFNRNKSRLKKYTLQSLK